MEAEEAMTEEMSLLYCPENARKNENIDLLKSEMLTQIDVFFLSSSRTLERQRKEPAQTQLTRQKRRKEEERRAEKLRMHRKLRRRQRPVDKQVEMARQKKLQAGHGQRLGLLQKTDGAREKETRGQAGKQTDG